MKTCHLLSADSWESLTHLSVSDTSTFTIFHFPLRLCPSL